VGVADFANGISMFPFGTHLFINADLTIHMFQPHEGRMGWNGQPVTSRVAVGMSDTALFDTEGRIGRSEQSLLLELR
jgi:hypothetical protein